MARSDLLVNLVRAGSSGNDALFKNTVNAIIAEERSKQHHTLVEKLIDSFQDNKKHVNQLNTSKVANGYVHQVLAAAPLESLSLSSGVKELVHEVIEEHQRIELLRSYGLEPRNRILLVGPPGNGKTTLAGAIADRLMIPMFVINYANIIGSYLGETTSRLAKVLEEVRAHHCVLFIDEFETIAKERGDKNETGEIKRVVSSLLLEIDQLPSHVIVIAASNHPELLDRAIWRRFPVKLKLRYPSTKEITEYLINQFIDFPSDISNTIVSHATQLKGLSYSDIENFCLDIKRRFVLSGGETRVDNILAKQLSRLNRNVSEA